MGRVCRGGIARRERGGMVERGEEGWRGGVGRERAGAELDVGPFSEIHPIKPRFYGHNPTQPTEIIT